MFASDAGVLEPDRGRPHPRAYGTHARVLRHYVRERGLLTLEEAVRRMTSLPAGHFGLDGRGRLAPGLRADLVVFDAAEVVDRATFEHPHAHPDGVRFVVVNGEVAAEDGRPTGARPGTVLLGPGVSRAAR
jgi:N-acyl-D-amino-acid deacylase